MLWCWPKKSVVRLAHFLSGYLNSHFFTDEKKWSKDKLASRLEHGAEVVKAVYRLVQDAMSRSSHLIPMD